MPRRAQTWRGRSRPDLQGSLLDRLTGMCYTLWWRCEMEETRETPSGLLPGEYDRAIGMLHDLPDVVKTKPAIKRVVPLLGVGGVKTFVVQSIRQANQGDTLFLEIAGTEYGYLKLVLPAAILETIVRQQDTLTALLRRKLARQAAADRKAQGLKPGFKMTLAEREAARVAREAKAKTA